MSPEELFYNWESFTFNKKTIMGHFAPEQIDGFRDYINQEIKSKAKLRTSSNTPARGSAAVAKATKSAYGARVLAGAASTPQSALRNAIGRSSLTTEDAKPVLPLNLSEAASGSGVSGKNIVVPATNTAEFSCE